MVDCETVRDTSLAARQFFIRYRVSAILVGLTIVNLLLRYIESKVVTRFSSYKYHSAETNQMMAIRFLQLLFGSIVSVCGYGTLLFNGISGCNASELYLFYFGGALLLFLDLHEYVRSWPLRAPILGHHLMVFFFGLAMIEYDLIPPPNDPNPEISWATTLLVANIGLMWLTDFFHVIYRVSTSLPLIEKFRKIYLISAIIRPFTFCLMVYGAAESIMDGSIAGAIPSILLSLAYGYNLFKAIQFVYMFDCEKYFFSHQVEWAQKSFDVQIDRNDVRKIRTSMKYDLSKLPDEIFAESEIMRKSSSFKHGVIQFVEEGGSEQRKSSILDRLFSIDIEDEPTEIMEGLRGDIHVHHELKEA